MDALSLLVAALALKAPAHVQLKAVKPPPLSVDCDDLDLAPLADALEQLITWLNERGDERIRIGRHSTTRARYASGTLAPLRAYARNGQRKALCRHLRRRASWLRLGDRPILFTAYHTPSVRGSLAPDATYRFPLYRRPDGPLAASTTEQVLAGVLHGFELVWLADAYDALAVQIEGGGLVELPDGRRYPIGTDGQNGHPYVNVTRLIAADGKLPHGPMPPSSQPGSPRVRAFFAAHPDELNAYWAKNPHFVYFKPVERAGRGRLGTLTPGRSIAVDEAQVPLGALMYIRTQRPIVENGQVTGWQPMSRVVLGQDTGAAIKGSRIDVYMGDDDYALVCAQSMTVRGDAFVLMGR
jgi:membrane-bound lytic murein transglycosylase A